MSSYSHRTRYALPLLCAFTVMAHAEGEAGAADSTAAAAAVIADEALAAAAASSTDDALVDTGPLPVDNVQVRGQPQEMIRDDPENAVATAAPSTPGVEFLWELDIYYSSASVAFPLDDRPALDGGAMIERDVYKTLFRESLRPRILLLEASAYPLPAAGAWLRSEHPDSYNDFDIGTLGGDDLNLIEGLTAGYQEPWALSAFVGSEMTFTREGDRNRRQNRGYMGYLASFGKKHLRSNYLIDDDWWEVEWKLKGEREFRDEQLSWSFRLGSKNHGNRDIRDVFYLGFRRDNLDFGGPILSFLRNSSLELMTEAASGDFNFLRQEIIFGKKFPIRRWHIAGQVDFGVIFEDRSKYGGELAEQEVDEFTFVLRPNIDW